MNPITRWAYKKVAQHQRYYERTTRRNTNYFNYIAKANLFDPLFDILPNSPRFWEWNIQMGKSNRIVLENSFMLLDPFANQFHSWSPFTATLQITKIGDMTLNDIKFTPKLAAWLADNETQLWTIMLDALYAPEPEE